MIKKIFFLIFIIFCFNIFSNTDYSTSDSNSDISVSEQNTSDYDSTNISSDYKTSNSSDSIGVVILILIFLIPLFGSNPNVDYNVFVILDNNTTTNVENISKKLKENGIESLYEKKYIIQLTLYLTKYNMNHLHKIKEIIEKIANQTKSFNVEFYRLRKTDRKLLVLDAKNNENIQQLADEITVNLTKYHAKNINVPDWIKYIPEREKLFKLYGSSDVFTNFEPYIPLLSQVNSSQIQSFISKYNFNPFKSKAIGIGIAQVDNLGQAKDIIYSIKFKQ
ncbi:Uncharacterised protein [uncultured Leptotrichia sp.]|uniref:hypothetical protein n=1 Tax=uncultured Leptotrichia sp. TaxID=159271 RepID=UPI001A4D6B0D|nr:hypothetical protein [uncultured Leptotrichia sp.]VTX52759.1 Uncharacterised protein [uncultured Leptotrichia sp.]